MKIIFLILCSILSLKAIANDSSLYFFTPSKMQSSVEAKYFMGPRINYSTDSTDMTFNTSTLSASYSLGITDTLSLGLSSGYSDRTITYKDSLYSSKSKSLGMTDLVFNGKWRDEWWFVGLEIGYSPEPNKYSSVDLSGTKHNGNSYTGGNRLKPSLGAIFQVSDFNFGVETSYDYHFESTSKNYDGDTTKTTNDHIFIISPFAEWNYGLGFLSAKLSRYEAMKYHTKDTSYSSLGTAYNSENDYDGYIAQVMNFSGSFNFSPNFSLLFSHDQMDVPKYGGNYSNYVIFTDSLGLRLLF